MMERMLTDAHTHMGTDYEHQIRRRHGIRSYLCASTPEEAQRLLCLWNSPAGREWICPTFGLHPWQADRYSVEDMRPYLGLGVMLGEIGMDSVWCDVDLERQRAVFCRQLEIAQELHKPVVLHTKGCEEEIAGIIRDYPNRYLVHWYSCKEHLKDYISQDCYFTVGPDVERNPAVHQVMEQVPLERLLVETDGYASLKWCGLHFRTGQPQVLAALENSVRVIAGCKGVSEEEVLRVLEENRKRLEQIF